MTDITDDNVSGDFSEELQLCTNCDLFEVTEDGAECAICREFWCKPCTVKYFEHSTCEHKDSTWTRGNHLICPYCFVEPKQETFCWKFDCKNNYSIVKQRNDIVYALLNIRNSPRCQSN